MPSFLKIGVCNSDVFGANNFFIGFDKVFILLEEDNPSKSIDEFLSVIGGLVLYEAGSASFATSTNLRAHSSISICTEDLHEILLNMSRENFYVIFIERNQWYCDVYDAGLVYPLPGVSASAFFDYRDEMVG